jgi:hypothetical protein
MAEKEKQKAEKHENIFTFQILHKHHKVLKGVLVAVIALFAIGAMAVAARQYSVLKRIENTPAPQVVLPSQEAAAPEEILPDPPAVDTADWKAYNNPYYGFKLKYPSDWKKPTVKSPLKGSKWQYRYLFRKSETNDSLYIGFDVIIYDVKKAKELADTEEFPKLKNQEQEPSDACVLFEGRLTENPNYPAEEIYIPPTDDCYNTDFFYTLTRNEYIYNFVPVIKEGADKPDNPKAEAINKFPEFFGAASSMELIDIVRPAPQAVAPAKSAPKASGITCIKIPANILAKLKNPPTPPDGEKKDGKLICHVLADGKKDNPHKSDKNPKGEWGGCCYDPDEVPNPRCCYPVGSVYEKYLKKYFEHPFYPKK